MRRDETATTRGAGRSVLWLGAHSDDIEIAAEGASAQLAGNAASASCALARNFETGQRYGSGSPISVGDAERHRVFSLGRTTYQIKAQVPATNGFSWSWARLGRGICLFWRLEILAKRFDSPMIRKDAREAPFAVVAKL